MNPWFVSEYSGLNTVLVNTTGASSVWPTDLGVAGFSPLCAPGILDKKILLAVLSSITDCEYALVQNVSAPVAGNHAPCVVLEESRISVDLNRYWSDRNLCSEEEWGVACHYSYFIDLCYPLTRFTLIARTCVSVDWSVRVVLLGRQLISLQIHKGSALITGIAPGTFELMGNALDHLLHWKLCQLVEPIEISAFKCASCREGPVRTTIPLITDRSNSPSCHPINLWLNRGRLPSWPLSIFPCLIIASTNSILLFFGPSRQKIMPDTGRHFHITIQLF